MSLYVYKQTHKEAAVITFSSMCELAKPHLKWQYSHMWVKVNVLWIWPISEKSACWWDHSEETYHSTAALMLLSSHLHVSPYVKCQFSTAEGLYYEAYIRAWLSLVATAICGVITVGSLMHIFPLCCIDPTIACLSIELLQYSMRMCPSLKSQM